MSSIKLWVLSENTTGLEREIVWSDEIPDCNNMSNSQFCHEGVFHNRPVFSARKLTTSEFLLDNVLTENSNTIIDIMYKDKPYTLNKSSATKL